MNRIIACTGMSLAVVLIGFSLSSAQPDAGQPPVDRSFQVAIGVFTDTDPSPVAEHLVVFDHDTIYCFPTSASEPATTINFAADRVTLLDRASLVHTTISCMSLASMTAQLRSSATSDALQQRLGINAKVQTDAAGNYSVDYGEIHYTTSTQKPEDPQWAIEFGRFADCASRLNIAQQRGLPPFGRMLMNSQIAADGSIPLETRLQFQQGDQQYHYRSTHDVTGGISDAARTQISQVKKILASSQAVPLNEFPK